MVAYVLQSQKLLKISVSEDWSSQLGGYLVLTREIKKDRHLVITKIA